MSLNPIKWKLHWQIFASLGLAILTMVILRSGGLQDSTFASVVIDLCEFAGTLFLNALKMIVVPLIVCAVISAVIGLGNERNFGRLGGKVFIYYMASGFLAIVMGLLAVNVIRPGEVSEATADRLLAQAQDPSALLADAQERSSADFVEVILRMFPPNVIEAATSNGSLLGVIVFSLFFGYFVTRLGGQAQATQKNFWDSAYAVMMKMADFIIRFAPIGVFGLVTPKLFEFGWDLFIPLLKFTITVLLALGLHLLLTLSVALMAVGRVSPLQHLRGMSSALLTAFSTASSVSTLPVTLDCVRDNAKVSRRVSSFTLPLGATVNMDGTALYECVVVIFVAQFQAVLDPSITFGLTEQILVVLMALLTSIGVAGIPQASLVAIVVIMQALGLNLEYIGIIMVVDRILDMCRTAVNIYSDSVGAVVIARTEGETPYSEAIATDSDAQPAARPTD
ncbi:MAG: dicarboxylate/amino acid:cation symporter [Opitutales bacterium]